MRVVVPDDYNRVYAASPQVARLRRRAEVVIYTAPASNEGELVSRLQGAQALILNRERVRLPARVLAALPDLELISQTGRGVPHIDMRAATEQGIVVTGTAAPTNPSTVELTFGLILALARRLPQNHQAMRQGEWPWDVGTELNGKTLGILGLGRIGTPVARVGQAFGMRVIAWGPTLRAERAAAAGVEFLPLEEVLTQADILTIHLQFTDLSRGLLDRRRLALLKPGAVLINTSRGPIVDEGALLDALRSGRLQGAALDVYGQEPLPADHPLRSLDNVILTPHLGWVTRESYERFISAAVDNVLAYLDGKPTNVLNPQALEVRRARV